MNRPITVDEYIDNKTQWQNELKLLRLVFLSTKLDEGIKWGAPIYTLKNKNVAGIAAFKSYVGIWFHQGALLKDNKKKLVSGNSGVTKALRQWRFQSLEEIKANQRTILKYLEEAILNQEKGKVIKPAQNKPLVIPEELQKYLSDDPDLNQSFEALNLTRKRDFADYIREAKRAETKQKRLDKIIPMIFKRIGLNDRYKK
ncbi:MAG TPA: YdeI/OmpD-associated family protein [Sunxiuqinia sp.]|nr:YdeI/OmpD-associated family protein [Sunxiuqinia sp.]